MKTLAHENDLQEVLQRLAQLTSTSQRRWGKMTAHQMVCHLTDSFKAVIGEKQVSSASKFFYRTFVKWLALYAPLPWPHGVSTRPEMDQEANGTQPVEFAQDSRALEEMIRRVAAQPRDFVWHSHPLFGKMSDGDWLRWAYLHVDHHLRQFGI
jgi:hypothetical protein